MTNICRLQQGGDNGDMKLIMFLYNPWLLLTLCSRSAASNVSRLEHNDWCEVRREAPELKYKNRFGSVGLHMRVYASQMKDGIRMTETPVPRFRF